MQADTSSPGRPPRDNGARTTCAMSSRRVWRRSALLMFGLGWNEILFVAALALVVVGPDRLPEMLKFLGRQYG